MQCLPFGFPLGNVVVAIVFLRTIGGLVRIRRMRFNSSPGRRHLRVSFMVGSVFKILTVSMLLYLLNRLGEFFGVLPVAWQGSIRLVIIPTIISWRQTRAPIRLGHGKVFSKGASSIRVLEDKWLQTNPPSSPLRLFGVSVANLRVADLIESDRRCWNRTSCITVISLIEIYVGWFYPFNESHTHILNYGKIKRVIGIICPSTITLYQTCSFTIFYIKHAPVLCKNDQTCPFVKIFIQKPLTKAEL
ncbi:unnamed protein product [Linum tenue]|uniref:Uncharacterized protein n=1 Tax=Linum tenue TaxID=586396 RepID=A0AAV0L5E4_9ROSI|nr:unnamed protein product [Linum tenue]